MWLLFVLLKFAIPPPKWKATWADVLSLSDSRPSYFLLQWGTKTQSLDFLQRKGMTGIAFQKQLCYIKDMKYFQYFINYKLWLRCDRQSSKMDQLFPCYESSWCADDPNMSFLPCFAVFFCRSMIYINKNNIIELQM